MKMYREQIAVNKQIGKKRLDYILLYLLIAIGSMPFFTGNEFLFLFLIVALIIFIYEKHRIDKFIVYYSIFYFSLFIAQSIFFSVIEFGIIIAYLARIFYAYFVFKILGKNLSSYFVNIIYFFSILSLLIYLPTLFFPSAITSILDSIAETIKKFQLNPNGRAHILIYTYGEGYSEESGLVSFNIPRNSGPFWEPGGFGVFLILAMIFELVESKKLVTKKNIIFLIALITTLSTASFVALFLFLIFYLLIYDSKYKLLYFAVLFILAFIVYTNAFFLTQKVDRDVNTGKYKSLRDLPRNRFISAQLDLMDFVNYPILGRGRYVATRFDTKEEAGNLFLNHRNNGTTNLLVEFGFFGFLFFFGSMYQSFRNFCIVNKWRIRFAFFLTLLVSILGFSQMIFNKPMFIGVSFMFLIGGRQKLISVTTLKKI